MVYVIKKDGVFVARSGHPSSYTTDLRYAQKYQTREEAERNQCPQNERIVELERVLDEYRS